jgi:hypothetical protein
MHEAIVAKRGSLIGRAALTICLSGLVHRFGHEQLAAALADAEGAAAQATEAVDTSATLSAYMADNDADEVTVIRFHPLMLGPGPDLRVHAMQAYRGLYMVDTAVNISI